jgi:uncharacterized protein
MSVKIYTSVQEMSGPWPSSSHPFQSQAFFLALEKSQCIGGGSGWMPLFLQETECGSILFSFIKTHSYGEYIFDWSWANAFEEHGLNYYPKLTSMSPFSSVTLPHFIGESSELSKIRLLKELEGIYEASDLSSNHFLFITKEETYFFKSHGYLIRESLQYHFVNQGWSKFDEFLNSLKSKKQKHVRQERHHPKLSIKKLTGKELEKSASQRMYQYYLSTIDHKNSYPYLNQIFFDLLFENLKDQLLLVEASDHDGPFAGSLFFYDQEKLYGRYWGSLKDIPNLHFELCYYQGIEFALEKELKIFEAGAQGEHKITRGFKPVSTYSAHKIKHPQFSKAVSEFIQLETQELGKIKNMLELRLPYKKSQQD